MRNYAIAAIPGDGIGNDVIEAGLKVLRAAEEVDGGVKVEVETFPWSCTYYLEHGRMMPEDGLKTLEPFDAIYLGAVRLPEAGPGPHLALGPAPADPQGLRPLRQPPPDQAAAGA